MHTTTRPSTVQRLAVPADVPVVARVLADAFADDPVFRWCLPDDRRRAEVLPEVFWLVADAVVPHGASTVSLDGEAAALWLPAGVAPVAPDDAARFEGALAELLGADGERTFAVMALLDEHHPTEPNRFLWFIGVAAHGQGRGTGSAMLAEALAHCDREGTPAYLDATSEHNRRLYERHGFEVMARRSVAGSPPLYPMWRSPRVAARN